MLNVKFIKCISKLHNRALQSNVYIQFWWWFMLSLNIPHTYYWDNTVILYIKKKKTSNKKKRWEGVLIKSTSLGVKPAIKTYTLGKTYLLTQTYCNCSVQFFVFIWLFASCLVFTTPLDNSIWRLSLIARTLGSESRGLSIVLLPLLSLQIKRNKTSTLSSWNTLVCN